MEAWRHGGMEAWRYGGMEAWRKDKNTKTASDARTRKVARKREKEQEVISPLRGGRLCVSARASDCPGLGSV
jgi:hypothetical protein